MTRLLQILTLSCVVFMSGRLTAAEPNRILVHGHRGARAKLPENTIPAFEYAIREGADALEMDLQVTKDNVLVVSHDPMLHPPICAGPQASAAIRQLTLAQVREWDCGATKNPAFPDQKPVPGTRIPTFDEALNLASKGKFDYNVEMKSDPAHPEYVPPPDEFAKMVWAKVREHKLEDRMIIQSFDWRTLVALRKIAPKVRISALTDKDQRDFAAISKDAGNAQIISAQYGLVTPEKVAAAHAVGLQVVPWTPNTPELWDKLIAAKVDAIITDNPAALIAYLKKK